MSRSYYHTPIMGVTGHPSCKAWRSQENRKYRAYIRDEMHHGRFDTLPGYYGRFGNEWDSPRDGKCWFGEYKWISCPHVKWYGVYPIGCGTVVQRNGKVTNDHHCYKYYAELMRK